MLVGSTEYKVFKAWCYSNPKGTVAEWKSYWEALNALLEVR